MASEELERRIQNLIGMGGVGAAMSDAVAETQMTEDRMKKAQMVREMLGAQVTERELEKLLELPDMELAQKLREISGAQVTERELERMMGLPTKRETDSAIDQDMNLMMARQGARKGISAVEQRAMTLANYLRETDREAPEEVVNDYAIGNISFNDAVQLSQPIEVIDEITVTGEMPDMTPSTRPYGVGASQMTDTDLDRFMQSSMTPSAAVTDAQLMELEQSIRQLEMERDMTSDPEERAMLDRMIENAIKGALAPQRELVQQLSQTAGEDDMMAHVRSGDVNVSREMLENNPQLEDMIEQAAIDAGIDPESMVYGTGIATLNEVTGAEEHGFLKKVGKFVKKVARKAAPVLQFVPGPIGAVAATVNRIQTVADVARGKRSPIALAGLSSGPTGAFGRMGQGGTGFFSTPGINPSAATTAGGGGIPDLLGRAKEYILPGADGRGLFKNVASGIGRLLGGGQQATAITKEDGTTEYQDAEGNVITKEQYDAIMQAQQEPRFSGLFGPDSVADKIFNIDPNKGTGPLSFITDRIPSMRTDDGALSGAGMLGIGALAAGLGKLAYEDTKKQKGVQLTPLLTMNAAGRYNLESEIARRMGQRPPNPTEFGLLPANTIPQLSGGRAQVMEAAKGGEVEYPNKGLEALAKVAPDVVKKMGYNMGGYVMPMAYAEGGNVAMEDFERMNGQISGAGTETSDDIPAMLSDGEFVMTGQAVRGAGSYEMKNDSGILTLTPSGAPSRDGGTDLMYKLMEAFASQAKPA